LNDATPGDSNQETSVAAATPQEQKKKGGNAGGWVRAEDGIHGVIISCDLNKEPKCTKEMLDLLNEVADQYFPIGGAPTEAEASDLSVELRKELDLLKSGASRRFFAFVSDFPRSGSAATEFPRLIDHSYRCCSVQTNCKNMVFIRFAEDNLDPVAVVNKIFEHVLTSGEARTRFTNKIIPICKTAPSFLDRLVQVAKPLMAQHFHKTAGKVLSFMVDYRHRYTDSIRKDESTKELVRMVGRPHKVDLNNPDKVIIVEVFNKALGMSIVEGDHYRKYKSYNLRQVTEKMPRRKDDDEEEAKRFKRPREDAGDGSDLHVASAPVAPPVAAPIPAAAAPKQQNQPQHRMSKQQRWEQEDQEAEDERRRSVELIPVRAVAEDGSLELNLEFTEDISPSKSKKRKHDDSDQEDKMVYDLTAQTAVRLL
jgi:tRNA acetyltransferase TAN1